MPAVRALSGGGISKRRGAQDEGVTGAKIMTRGSMRGVNPRPDNSLSKAAMRKPFERAKAHV